MSKYYSALMSANALTSQMVITLFIVAAGIVTALYIAKRYTLKNINAADALMAYLTLLSIYIPLVYTGAINLVTW